MGESRIQRAIGSIYSWSAGTVYEPLIVRGTFRILGGHLDDLVADQGRRAATAAGGRPILDIPVGTAHFTIETARLSKEFIVGADYAWGMADTARRAGRRAGLDDLAIIQADVHHLPFPDRAFGAIMCTNGLQVIPGLTAAVQELARVLADGGAILVSVIAAPLGALLPERANRHLPALLRTGPSIASEFSAAGLTVTALRRSRFAYLMEAVKLRK